MINQQKQAKVDLNGTKKRFNIPETYQEFKHSCEKAYNLPQNGLDNFIISYIDDEEDKVIISNEFDYDQAILFVCNPSIQYLRINLESKNPQLDLTKINVTDSLNFHEPADNEIKNTNEVISYPQFEGQDYEKILEFDDLQKEIDIQKQKLEEEEKMKSLTEGVRESHYNILESLAGNLEKREENYSSEKLPAVIEERKESAEDLNESNSEKQIIEVVKEVDDLIVIPVDEADTNKKEIQVSENLDKNVELNQKNHENSNDNLVVKDDKEEVRNSVSDENKINEVELYLEQQREEILKEKRKLTVLERIRKKAQEDLLKNNNFPLKKEDKLDKIEGDIPKVQIEVEFQKEKEIEKVEESNLQAVKDELVEINQIVSEDNELIKCNKEKKKKCCQREKSSDEEKLNKSFNGDPTQVESELRERIVKSTQKFIENKFNRFKEVITNKVIERTNLIINKYIEYVNKQNQKRQEIIEAEVKQEEINQPEIKKEIEILQKKELAIHNDIRCDGCHIKPIIGDRYKCSICDNFDFCEKCEEENFSTHLKHSHPFIRIRHPIYSPDILKSNNVNNFPRQIESKNNSGFEGTSNIFFGASTYSSQCLNQDLEFNYELDSSENPKKIITLKNNGSISWPKPCFLGCLKEKSTLICPTIPIAAKMTSNAEINLEIKFDLPENKNLQPGKYSCYLQLYQSSAKNYFGEEFCVVVNVIQPEYITRYNKMKPRERKKFDELVKNMRDSYQISKDLYEDSEILKALIHEDGDKEKALMLLLENSR